MGFIFSEVNSSLEMRRSSSVSILHVWDYLKGAKTMRFICQVLTCRKPGSTRNIAAGLSGTIGTPWTQDSGDHACRPLWRRTCPSQSGMPCWWPACSWRVRRSAKRPLFLCPPERQSVSTLVRVKSATRRTLIPRPRRDTHSRWGQIVRRASSSSPLPRRFARMGASHWWRPSQFSASLCAVMRLSLLFLEAVIHASIAVC